LGAGRRVQRSADVYRDQETPLTTAAVGAADLSYLSRGTIRLVF
jgi:hypothetical protein